MAWTEPLRDDHWRRLRAILRDFSGMDCPDNRLTDLQEATAKAARFADETSIESLIRRLQAPGEEVLRSVWLSAFTIHETYFFRDAPQWNAIRKRVLPERIQARRSEKSLKVWSAGCSTGEEAYTAAIVLKQLVPDSSWRPRVIGTDISADVITKARKGLFREWAFRQTPMHLRDDYFEPSGHHLWKISDEISRLVHFDVLNLKTGSYPSIPKGLFDLDLILCRNVLIYFAREEMDRVIARLTDCLAPGGYLALGPAEPFPPEGLPLELVASEGSALYRRISDKAAAVPMIDTTRAVRSSIEPIPQTDSPISPSKYRSIEPKPSSHVFPRSRVHSNRTQAPSGPADDVGITPHDMATRPNPDITSTTGPLSPTESAALSQARALANSGNWEDTLKAAEALIASRPDDSEALYLKALALKELGRLIESRDTLRKCLFHHSSHWMAHLLAAGLWQREGQNERARSHLSTILNGLATMDPSDILPATEGINVGRMRALADSQLKHLEGRN